MMELSWNRTTRETGGTSVCGSGANRRNTNNKSRKPESQTTEKPNSRKTDLLVIFLVFWLSDHRSLVFDLLSSISLSQK